MGLGKQAKVLNTKQVDAVLHHVGSGRYGLRNQVIFLLSVKAGLRAKEIAHLKWSMVLGADGQIGDAIHLTNEASKGRSGRIIPLNSQLRAALVDLHRDQVSNVSCHIVATERSASTSSQAIVNLFRRWYLDLGLIGCSSHSGRRVPRQRLWHRFEVVI